MSPGYKFYNPEGAYFISFSVIKWINLFEEEEYINILLDTLRYSQQNKGMEIYAWCIMTNHVHLVFRSISGIKPDQLVGDLKRFTSNNILKSIKSKPNEGRNKWILEQFSKAAEKSSNVKHFQLWQHTNHPIEIWSNKFIRQKINYTHKNPVAGGLVKYPDDYKYSSAKDYCGEKGLLDNIVIQDL